MAVRCDAGEPDLSGGDDFCHTDIGVIGFSITQGLVELALYFRVVMPRLRRQGIGAGMALTLAALMHWVNFISPQGLSRGRRIWK